MAEAEDDTRFPFQRDRGRIIHTQAFRRLLGKTQVFVAGEGDHYRTRLTHTLEVAHIARDIARTMRLNEDLAECIALAHDLGHPPFGHMGEYAIDEWMRTHGSAFEHNAQSLRIVTLLEWHNRIAPGLNLSQEILDGLQKHRPPENRGGRALSLEAQTVNLADEIAYTAHDCEDGLGAGLFTLRDLEHVEIIRTAQELMRERQTALRGGLIHLLVSDLYTETDQHVKTQRIASLDDVYTATVPLIAFSSNMRASLNDLRTFLTERMYHHPQVLKKSEEGQAILHTLCRALYAQPTERVLALQRFTESTLAEAVKDYVAGMTDAYARGNTERKLIMQN